MNSKPRPATPAEWHYCLWNRLLFIAFCSAALLLATARVSTSGLTLPFMRRPLPQMCAYKAHHGVECPSCGITRSCAVLMQGDYARSVEFHPYGRLLVGFLLVQVMMRGALSRRGAVRYWKYDLAATAALFVVCFAPFCLS